MYSQDKGSTAFPLHSLSAHVTFYNASLRSKAVAPAITLLHTYVWFYLPMDHSDLWLGTCSLVLPICNILQHSCPLHFLYMHSKYIYIYIFTLSGRTRLSPRLWTRYDIRLTKCPREFIIVEHLVFNYMLSPESLISLVQCWRFSPRFASVVSHKRRW